MRKGRENGGTLLCRWFPSDEIHLMLPSKFRNCFAENGPASQAGEIGIG